VPTFCRHNRFFAECPICSKGTVLDPSRSVTRRSSGSGSRSSGSGSRSTGGTRRRSTTPAAGAPRAARGPFVAAGPYDGAEVRLERVPGGLRMASWRGGQIERTAPVLDAADAPALLAEAATKDLLAVPPVTNELLAAPSPDNGGARGEVGTFGASPGRSGELRDELRVERIDERRIRVARWIMRPNRGWELQEAPVMLPPTRFTQALAAAAGKGVLASGGPAE
jgi:hypothetical protein